MFSWLRKNEHNGDYEKLLAELDLQIHTIEMKISEIGLKQRAATSALLFYTLPVWLSFTVFYLLYSKNADSHLTWQVHALQLACVLLGPIIIWSFRKLILVWYQSKKSKCFIQLEKIKSKQRSTIEELKKKTSYYTTKGLIERYDTPIKNGLKLPSSIEDVTKTPSPLETTNDVSKQLFMQPTPSQSMSIHTPIVTQTLPYAPPPSQPQVTPTDPIALSRNNSSSQPQSPSRSWLDKLMDTVIGDVGGPSSKYALVCENCFTHNGLTLPELYPSQFRCMRCQHFNQSKRMRNDVFESSPLPSTSLSLQSNKETSQIDSIEKENPIQDEDDNKQI